MYGVLKRFEVAVSGCWMLICTLLSNTRVSVIFPGGAINTCSFGSVILMCSSNVNVKILDLVDRSCTSTWLRCGGILSLVPPEGRTGLAQLLNITAAAM